MVSAAQTRVEADEVIVAEPPQEGGASIEDLERAADARAAEGAIYIAELRASCGMGCMRQCDGVACPAGKLNGSIEECRASLKLAIFQLRMSAQRAWLKLLEHLGKTTLSGDSSENICDYGELFDTLFDHGPIRARSEILALSKSADSIRIDDTTRRMYADVRQKLITYLVAGGFIENELAFTHHMYELVLFASCFAKLEDLNSLQGQILESREKTRDAIASAQALVS